MDAGKSQRQWVSMTLAAARGMGITSSLQGHWHWLGSLVQRDSGEIKFTGVINHYWCVSERCQLYTESWKHQLKAVVVTKSRSSSLFTLWQHRLHSGKAETARKFRMLLVPWAAVWHTESQQGGINCCLLHDSNTWGFCDAWHNELQAYK